MNLSDEYHIAELSPSQDNAYFRSIKRKFRRAAYGVTGFRWFKAPEDDDPYPFVVQVKNSLRSSRLWIKDLGASTTVPS